LANLAFQFSNPQVEPFDFLEGDEVYFPQQFNNLGLVGVLKCIMTAGERFAPSAPPSQNITPAPFEAL